MSNIPELFKIDKSPFFHPKSKNRVIQESCNFFFYSFFIVSNEEGRHVIPQYFRYWNFPCILLSMFVKLKLFMPNVLLLFCEFSAQGSERQFTLETGGYAFLEDNDTLGSKLAEENKAEAITKLALGFRVFPWEHLQHNT